MFDLKNKTIDQIKNVIQEKHPEQNTKKEKQQTQELIINSFDDLLEICNLKKEIKIRLDLIDEHLKSIIKIDKNRGIIITETKLGHICANSGIDSSNIYGTNNVSLLPKDPDKSAKFIYKNLKQKFKLENLGIIISDTFGRPWRIGQTNISIGSYGINPFIDYRNNTDAFGKKLNTTKICIVDELSGGAEILMEKSLKIPAVLIRGVKFQFSNQGSKEILRDKNLDLFR